MRRAIRERLTYANAVATLALFLALGGGTAIALSGSNTVFSDDIVPREVRSSDIAPGAVGSGKVADEELTGADVSNASTLGHREIDEGDLTKVPSAANADFAAAAGAADVAGGVTPKRIYFSRDSGDGVGDPVLDLGGLVLTASCGATGGNDLTVTATTTVDHATLQATWVDSGGFESTSRADFGTTDQVSPALLGDADPVQGTLTYTAPVTGSQRRVVTVVYGGDEDVGQSNATDCVFAGTAFMHSAPPAGG